MNAIPNSHGYPKPIGPWERRLQQGVVRLIREDEMRSWIVRDDAEILAVNKPGDVVCHPSKDGPWSSLSGAVRAYRGEGAAHLVFRLDRETSGLVIFAKSPATARRLQMAAQERRYEKGYRAIVWGELREPVFIDQPLGPDRASPVLVKSCVTSDGSGQPARTRVVPLSWNHGFTLVAVQTETGRKHQIRAHLQWLGHPIVGDKIYGPDARLFLTFIEHGWTPELATRLLLPRQALHCGMIDLSKAGIAWREEVPLAPDLQDFCRIHGLREHLPHGEDDAATQGDLRDRK